MEEKKSYLNELKEKLEMRMSIREDLFKERIENSFSVLSSALYQVSLELSENIREDLTRKFVKVFE